MSTVAQLIDRAYREWLYPPDEQPVRFTLAAEFATAATAFSVDADFLSPEEESLLGPGTIVEFGRELVQVGDYDETAATNHATSVKRGVLGTTPAAHAAGTYGIISPKFPRQAVFDAIADAVVGLWPDLYAVVQDTSRTFSATAHTEVPATVMQPLFLWARPSGATQYQRIDDIGFYDNFAGSTTGKAVYVNGLLDGSAGYMVYAAQFPRPTAETDDLVTTSKLQAEWEQIVLVQAVAYLIAGKDMSAVEQRYLSEQLSMQGFPPQTAGRIRDGLLRYAEYLLNRARKAQRGRYDVVVTMNKPF